MDPQQQLERANEAKAAAQHMRAQWLMMLARGNINLADLIEAATRTENTPLLKLPLVAILQAIHPTWTRAHTHRTLRTLTRLADSKANPTTLTLAWLMRSNTAGRRISALAQLDTPLNPHAPWPGFPWTPERHDQ
ncbi:hypothetical protein [Actinomyces sp. HMSC065F12]|uniref:hypothetical protein n=1 Tax=Actinomyces sp. HMSC065F12 TaxID=1739479 RepID=UPI00114CF5D4|nr:hypothetical protein [Actinomyces sp. HMSC065F12]